MKTKHILFLAPLLLSSITLAAQSVKVLEQYPNKSVKQELRTSADSSYAILIDYFKNGQKQSVDTLVNNHVNGWSTEYNEDGSVFVTQLFDFDKPVVQKFFLYYKDGKIKNEWVSDTLGRVADPGDIQPANGYWKEYYHNGKLKMCGRKNENRNLDGEWIYYDENGIEVKRVFYIDGKKLDK